MKRIWLVMALALPQVGQAQDQAAAERRALFEEIEKLKKQNQSGGDGHGSFGGYGEIHYNESEKTGGDSVDIHRLVLYLGHTFNERIQLNSEIELEHAFVAADKGGEFKIEQLHVEIELPASQYFKVGRVLAPLGIINQYHEPTRFNGVERPTFNKVIIPTTWSLDGVGFAGGIGEMFNYQLYYTSGLDGSKFDGTIRGGRQHERPSMKNGATSARVEAAIADPSVTVGLSWMNSGLNNGNKGADPGIDDDTSLQILETDIRASYSIVDLKAVWATLTFNEVEKLNDFYTASCEDGESCLVMPERQKGALYELGVHIAPQAWKGLYFHDLILFGRYEEIFLQDQMPDDLEAADSATQKIMTYGLSYFLAPKLVTKLDWQSGKDGGDEDLTKTFNAGIGWEF